MSFEFKLPDIGEGLTEGEVVKWLVKEGDRVEDDQPMVEVMTDKATVEITVPRAGVIEKIVAQEGQTIPVGSVMVVIAEGEGAAASEKGAREEEQAEGAEEEERAPRPQARKRPEAEPEAEPEPEEGAEDAAEGAKERPARAGKKRREEVEEEAGEEGEEDGEEAAEASAQRGGPAREREAPQAPSRKAPAGRERRDRTLAAPATRKRARELGVDVHEVPGTGPGGRVTRRDVENYAARGAAPAAAAGAEAIGPPRGGPPRLPVTPPAAGREDERVPIRGMRARIAEQMARAKQYAPHFTYADECDVTDLVALRAKAKEVAEPRGVKLTFLPFVIKALTAALRKFPTLNALVDDEAAAYVVRGEVHVGIATDTEEGLTVPVVKHADRLSVLEIASEIQRVTEAARTRKIALEDLRGGTITITSAGSIGGLLATPILNYPQVAILGVYKIREVPAVRDGQIVVRQVMNLSITLDHRIVDGGTAARFMNEMIRLLETPGLLLLEDR